MFALIRPACLALAIVTLPGMALADPPARVGRLAIAENNVDFQVDRSSRPEPATVNWPISDGAVIRTGRRGLAEVWIESTAYRLAGDSELEFAVVDDQRVIVNLDRGALAVNIADADQADDLTVQTPEGSIHFDAAGAYRIDVLSDHTEVTTRYGMASLADGGWRTSLGSGRSAEWYAGEEAQLLGRKYPDAFDAWVEDREAATLATTSRRHVSPYMTGYQDLDRFGDWATLPEYGAIWFPRQVDADWAPYRHGRWAWVAPWGWTWIDQAPWGFAPFHYGRWLKVRGRWAWVPGQHEQRPVYSPALVAWAGDTGWRASLSIDTPPRGNWRPLAPRDVYVPAYRHSPEYVRQLNHAHVRDERRIEQAVRVRPPEYRPQVEAPRPERTQIRIPERHTQPVPQNRVERQFAERFSPAPVRPEPEHRRAMREESRPAFVAPIPETRQRATEQRPEQRQSPRHEPSPPAVSPRSEVPLSRPEPERHREMREERRSAPVVTPSPEIHQRSAEQRQEFRPSPRNERRPQAEVPANPPPAPNKLRERGFGGGVVQSYGQER